MDDSAARIVIKNCLIIFMKKNQNGINLKLDMLFEISMKFNYFNVTKYFYHFRFEVDRVY